MRKFLIATILLGSSAAHADEPHEYAAFYGDGIRAYTESRYDDALTSLYRALAVKQTPQVIKLIIRTHDFQGNCSARERAAVMLQDAFPGQSTPPVQRCAEVGVLQIECLQTSGTVRVNRSFDAPCDSLLQVPVGAHDIEHVATGAAIRVNVAREETAIANVSIRPNKWYLEPHQRQVVELPSRWLEPNLRTDPDMPRTFKWRAPGR